MRQARSYWKPQWGKSTHTHTHGRTHGLTGKSRHEDRDRTDVGHGELPLYTQCTACTRTEDMAVPVVDTFVLRPRGPVGFKTHPPSSGNTGRALATDFTCFCVCVCERKKERVFRQDVKNKVGVWGDTQAVSGEGGPQRERASCLHGVPSISLTCHLTPVAAQCHLLCPVVYECLKQTVSSLYSQQLTISIDIIAHTYSVCPPTHPPNPPHPPTRVRL